jgi:hypothetical protein
MSGWLGSDRMSLQERDNAGNIVVYNNPEIHQVRIRQLGIQWVSVVVELDEIIIDCGVDAIGGASGCWWLLNTAGCDTYGVSQVDASTSRTPGSVIFKATY